MHLYHSLPSQFAHARTAFKLSISFNWKQKINKIKIFFYFYFWILDYFDLFFILRLRHTVFWHSKNFTAQGNTFLFCTHDNKHSESKCNQYAQRCLCSKFQLYSLWHTNRRTEYLDLHLPVSVPDPDDSDISRRHEEACLLLPVHHHAGTYDTRRHDA